jgi:chemotaxis protein histidine kinase CheA
MDNKNHTHAYQVIYRVLYLGGIFLLLAGMLLSFVDGSAQAAGLEGSHRHATATPRVKNVSKQKSNNEQSHQKQRSKTANSNAQKNESEAGEGAHKNEEAEGAKKTPTPVKQPTEVENPTEANESAATQEATQTPTQPPEETQVPTETATQAPTSVPQETQAATATPAETATSAPQETQAATATPAETATSAPQETQAVTPTQTQAASQVPGNVTGSVNFTDTSTNLCLFVPTTLEDTVVVTLSGGSAVLQTAWRVTQPADLSTADNFSEFNVSNGDSINVTGEWPGVRPTDTAVTVHFRATLLDAVSRNPISSEAGADFTWTPSFCAPPTAAVSNLSPSASGGIPAVSVPNTGSLAALPSPTPPPTVTPASNNQSSAVSGSVTHFSVPNTGFAAASPSPTPPPTVMPSFVVTRTATLVARSSPSPTVTARPTSTRTQAVPVTGGQATATLGPVGIPPTAASGQQQLVPVTGEDLTPARVPFAGLSLAQRFTLYLGLVFVGIAFILQGLSRRK